MSQISHQMKSTSKLEISYLEGSFSGLNDLLVVFPFDLPRERPQLDALCDTIIKCSEFQIGKFFLYIDLVDLPSRFPEDNSSSKLLVSCFRE